MEQEYQPSRCSDWDDVRSFSTNREYITLGVIKDILHIALQTTGATGAGVLMWQGGNYWVNCGTVGKLRLASSANIEFAELTDGDGIFGFLCEPDHSGKISKLLVPSKDQMPTSVAGSVWSDEAGIPVGAIVLTDERVRQELSQESRDTLRRIARLVGAYLCGVPLPERKKKLADQSKINKAKTELQLILDHIPIRIFFKDDKNHIVRANRAAADSLGMRIQELVGADTYKLFPQIAKTYHEDDLEVIDSGEPKLGIVERYEPEGMPHGWVRTDKIPYVDPDTGERFILVAASDISAEMEAITALKDSERRFRSLYNETPAMLLSLDDRGYLASVSDHWLDKMGYGRDEVIGREAADFVACSAIEKFRCTLNTLLSGSGQAQEIESQIVTKDGDRLDVLLSAIPQTDTDNSVYQVLAVLTDITERRAIERQFYQAQKMESVGQLTGGLAHDFNNLLSVVSGNLELLSRSAYSDEKSSRRIEAAATAVNKGAELTKKLLNFSRHQELETSNIGIASMIDDLEEILRRTLGESIVFECAVDDGLPAVRTDRMQLESALLNLAVNARDAMPEGGCLQILCAETEILHPQQTPSGTMAPGSYVKIAVSDNGEGMQSDQIAQIFEPFFTTKKFGKGSGLGMAMVYGLVQRSGGHVDVDSAPGKGTTVSLFFPSIFDQAVDDFSSQDNEAPITEGCGEVVLVVEDQIDVRETVCDMLIDLGYSIKSAGNGWQAIQILSSDQPVDLLFTDVVMPEGLNGISLARMVKTLRPEIPILFGTGYADPEILEGESLKSFGDCLLKPYSRVQLALAIANAMNSDSLLPAAAAGGH